MVAARSTSAIPHAERGALRHLRPMCSSGLRATPKRIPAKYFYDAAGSRSVRAHHANCRNITRPACEMSILREHAADIAKLIPPGAALVEFGSGSSKKARILLRAAPKLAAYVPVDICGEMLEQRSGRAARAISRSSRCCRSPPTSCKPFELPAEAEARRRASDFSRARPSAISSRTRRPSFCAMPRIFWARARR